MFKYVFKEELPDSNMAELADALRNKQYPDDTAYYAHQYLLSRLLTRYLIDRKVRLDEELENSLLDIVANNDMMFEAATTECDNNTAHISIKPFSLMQEDLLWYEKRLCINAVIANAINGEDTIIYNTVRNDQSSNILLDLICQLSGKRPAMRIIFDLLTMYNQSVNMRLGNYFRGNIDKSSVVDIETLFKNESDRIRLSYALYINEMSTFEAIVSNIE